MTNWTEFTAQAPRIAAIFLRRHRATGNLCLLATIRSDGFPRISPLEPLVFEDQLWLPGMPNTTKFADLGREPRFCLHTATADPKVTDGDAKLWGLAHDVTDLDLRRRFAENLYAETGFDLRNEEFALFSTKLTGASAVEVGDDHLDITVWNPGQPERVVRKH
ncbi:pyridoxamine 5-phosphate oxidase [Mycobacterium intermedium]|uniref:Pyridoxamine 5-phosphate oxidase n=1 Tax=Mycobacterium intermedium TaxID=28445 RepID=A0A1E3SBE0_MYCIE|nr:pyridoxamine 5'-phosphate oxidase family protein [Mycobacterium intermedium]MCV6962327.1 pyridoxamine 5'-phosphate oxidase family protein [Mycobacterium intermedium]ODQ99414.1 pyridoxamine 5-phosphate oxidase [Mycobacterium intermedium]OPE45732.1 pyridoxamine 5-phosphate oxidase [Mycobacterium intermedium]ORB00873.1 pyridoxamine 5-phosphate oxidase [Mycobacterium intermedium]